MAKAMTLDTREFNKAVVQYAAASKKDFKDIANKSLFDAALKSPRFIKNARRGAVSALLGQPTFLYWLHWQHFAPKGISRWEGFEGAKSIVKRRGKAIGFVKSFFRRMAADMEKYLPPDAYRIGSKSKGIFQGFKGVVHPATKRRPTASASVVYVYKGEQRKGTSKVERMLVTAMQGGFDATTADRMKYVDRKMGRTAKKYSARGAR